MNERKNEASWSESRLRWRIDVQRNGQRRTFYSAQQGRRGKLEAERKADEWLNGGRKKEMRVGELCKLYLDGIDTGHSSCHRLREESTINTWILPYWEHLKVDSLTNLDYKAAIYRPAECQPPRSKRTCGHVRSVISALYNTALMANVEMVPPYRLPLPKAATVKEHQVLTNAEFKRLLTEGNQYWYIHAFRFIAVLGLRRGELCGLRREDLDGNLLTIRRSVNNLGETTVGKTASAQRQIFLPKMARQILRDQRKQMMSAGIASEWLFANTNGEQIEPNALYNRWVFLRDRLELPSISIHDLRHTMISTVKNDVELPLIKSVVGHTPKMDTLGTYGHDTGNDAETAAAEIDAVFDRILETR